MSCQRGLWCSVNKYYNNPSYNPRLCTKFMFEKNFGTLERLNINLVAMKKENCSEKIDDYLDNIPLDCLTDMNVSLIRFMIIIYKYTSPYLYADHPLEDNISLFLS